MQTGREQCQLYIRLEHFRDDAQPLFDHLGFSLELPVVNESGRQRDWRVYYDDAAAEAVAAACARILRNLNTLLTILSYPDSVQCSVGSAWPEPDPAKAGRLARRK